MDAAEMAGKRTAFRLAGASNGLLQARTRAKTPEQRQDSNENKGITDDYQSTLITFN